MTETQEWLTLLVTCIAAALICAGIGMAILCLVDSARGWIHRYKTRRQWYRW